jgi:hypothetical protein
LGREILADWLLAVFSTQLVIQSLTYYLFTPASLALIGAIGLKRSGGGVCLSFEPHGCFTWSLPMAEQLDKSQGRIYCSYFENNNKEDA